MQYSKVGQALNASIVEIKKDFLHENIQVFAGWNVWSYFEEIYCAGRTGLSCEKSECEISHHARNRRLSVVQCVRISRIRGAPRGALGATDIGRACAIVSKCKQNQQPLFRMYNETWTWLETNGRVSPNTPLPLQTTVPFQPRFFLQELVRAHCPFQPPTEVTSLSSTRSLSGVLREPKVSSSSTSLPTADCGTTGSGSSQRLAQHQMSVHHSCVHFVSGSNKSSLWRSRLSRGRWTPRSDVDERGG